MHINDSKKPLMEAITNGSLISCLERHLGDSVVSERYAALVRQLGCKRFVLPVYGIQGTGKSTFLNALVFASPTLPVDADETTCVPVEIVHGVSPSPMAKAYFTDGRVQEVPATEEGLKSLVHNEDNPGNRLGVTRIVVESNDPILENGLVLVDLPGVGSLTKENVETTRKYITEASGVMFMLRTVPPITRTESVFIAANWARLPTAIFVQNRWTDESDDEAGAGQDHNVAVLSDVAKRCRVSIEGPPTVHLVNAYAALDGRLMDDQGAAKRSGIASVRHVLLATAASWPTLIVENVRGAVRTDLGVALDSAQTKLTDLTQSRETTLSEMEEERRRFQRYFAELEQRSGTARHELDSFSREVSGKVSDWASNTRSSLRNTMRTKMRAGIVDGPRLSRALHEEQSVLLDAIYAEIEDLLLTKREKIISSFEGVSSWRMQKFQTQKTVDKVAATKYENLIAPVAGSLGGVGGAWAGAQAGAVAGVALGPVGAVVGGVVGGIVGGLFGAWLGGKAKQAVTESRAGSVQDDVFGVIDDFVESTRTEFGTITSSLVRELTAAVDGWMRAQRENHEKERQDRLSALEMSNDKRIQAIAQLEADLAQLRQWVERLRGENHG